MTPWAIVLCEGAQDQKAIAAFTRTCGGWVAKDGVPNSLPKDLSASFPTVKRTASGAPYAEHPPDYLVKGDHCLVVRALGGVSKLLGQFALDYLGGLRPDAVGVVVDADKTGVVARLQTFRTVYERLYSHAGAVNAGSVSGTNPRLGLWVAPDNQAEERLDDLLIKAARCTRKRLVERGQRFATSLASVEPGKWTYHRNKAVLGAIHQVVSPGASLAVGLQKSGGWFDQSLSSVKPFKQMLQFIEALAGP